MSPLEVRPARGSDAAALRPRPEDLREIQQYGYLSPEAALRDSLAISGRAWAGTIDGRVVALLGVSQDDTGVHPWLMSDSALAGRKRAVLGLGRGIVDWLREFRAPVWNFISKDAHGSRRFVEHLGFVIEPLPDNPRFDRFYLP